MRIALMFLELGISRRDLAKITRWGTKQLTEAFTHARFPVRDYNRQEMISAFNEYCAKNPSCMEWLKDRGLPLSSLWDSIGDQTDAMSIAVRRIVSMKKRQGPPIIPGDPLEIKQKEEPVITQRTMKHFKLFRNPFLSEMKSAKDIYLGEEHIFLREMMYETARHQGFTAIVGEVGSGKSIMRKAVVEKLMKDGVRIIYPRIIDKSRISPQSLIDAIIMDVSEEHPKRSLEAKTRQAFRVLKNWADQGTRQVLIVEEAHMLSTPAIKCLKQIHELEQDFEKLLGIILIGQTELKHILDERMHPELREVIRRVTLAEITDLGKKDLGPYLKQKLDSVAQGKFEEIISATAIDAVLQRLPGKAYPLSVNNLVARAMNLAAEMGEPQVTAEVVLAA